MPPVSEFGFLTATLGLREALSEGRHAVTQRPLFLSHRKDCGSLFHSTWLTSGSSHWLAALWLLSMGANNECCRLTFTGWCMWGHFKERKRGHERNCSGPLFQKSGWVACGLLSFHYDAHHFDELPTKAFPNAIILIISFTSVCNL